VLLHQCLFFFYIEFKINLIGQRVFGVLNRYGADELDLADLDPSWYLHDRGAFVEGISLYIVGALKRALPFWATFAIQTLRCCHEFATVVSHSLGRAALLHLLIFEILNRKTNTPGL
jgi:hypothetical protein